MGENTITNVMKVSVAGISLKESEKKVYESLCKKNNSQEADESKDCKFRTYRQCHRPQRACPTGSCSFVGLWKIYSCLFIPNCTRNHVITRIQTSRRFCKANDVTKTTSINLMISWYHWGTILQYPHQECPRLLWTSQICSSPVANMFWHL